MDRTVTIKRKAGLNRKMEIDLTGPQGNAYFLLGTADGLYNSSASLMRSAKLFRTK